MDEKRTMQFAMNIMDTIVNPTFTVTFRNYARQKKELVPDSYLEFSVIKAQLTRRSNQ